MEIIATGAMAVNLTPAGGTGTRLTTLGYLTISGPISIVGSQVEMMGT